ncbi:MAG: alpha/beta hydrolase [Sphingomicrobium sp.]
MFEFQTNLIFPVDAVPAAGPLPRGADKLSVETPDGHTLAGVYIPADDEDVSRALVLGFGGNAWNGQDVAEYLHELFPEHEVVAFHYRGYPPSTGEPSGDALISDAPLVYDATIARFRPARVIAVGFSIGTGVAAQLASRRELDGLILVTPFDSLRAVAQSMYPGLPIGAFFSHEIDAAGPLEECQVPVAILAAERDEVVPAERTRELRKRVPNLVFDRTVAGSGHNDIYARSEFHDAMREALGALIDGQVATDDGT